MSKDPPRIVEKEHALDIDEEVDKITSVKKPEITNGGRYIAPENNELQVEEEVEEEEFKENKDEISEYSTSENGNNIYAGHTPHRLPESPSAKLVPCGVDKTNNKKSTNKSYCVVS